MMVRRPDHPRAATATGYVFEHIVVAEMMLGRPLAWFGKDDPRSEIVHHINGDKADNRPENLQVTTMREHGEAHQRVLRLGAGGAPLTILSALALIALPGCGHGPEALVVVAAVLAPAWVLAAWRAAR